MILLGLDPGLRVTGWGVIAVSGNRLAHVANGSVASDPAVPLAERLLEIHDGLRQVIADHAPDEAAVEETFVNANPVSTLKLGQARGVVLLVPALAGIPISEYAPNQIKRAVVGNGHASKEQIRLMVHHLLPNSSIAGADAADALAVAICHAHRAGTTSRWAAAAAGGSP